MMNDSFEFEDREEVAIIGMVCRFPGANNVDEFWNNLRNRVESITFFSDEELEAEGVSPSLLENSHYVKAEGILDGIELFDASFFGFTPREAAIMDPQHRFFLECAWEALENAGYDAEAFDGRIGVYAGSSMNHYLLNVYTNREAAAGADGSQITIGNDKDFLPTRVSYKLNLKGPSVNVQSACSTSLVAVCLAAQSLLNGECDMAMAGGASIKVPQKRGYLYQEGGIFSPDGHCRAFDARAQGTVGGRGVGIVVLKRLSDALTDGDTIRAVIKGFALNNDGSNKVGYTAPSVEGQAEVIAEALAMADVPAETINYVETHGTGTALGDPIEVAGLRQAFGRHTTKKGFCALGSVKTNIGHLDITAGVAGLIKTVLALEHKMIPPSLHYERANPEIGFEESPFYVNAELKEWKREGEARRAGVSSFGIGGTNAHVVLEEAPPVAASGESKPWNLLVLSAKTDAALETATTNLIEHLKRNSSLDLTDMAYTFQVGRRAFDHRRAVVCKAVDEAIDALEKRDGGRVSTRYREPADPYIIFMFPGGGSQYVNMGLGLYESEPLFREQIDSCSEILKEYLDQDLRSFLYPESDRIEKVSVLMKQTSTALPALFAVEYALARLWMSWGVHPDAMIGHSLGEYVAACLSGVFSLKDALLLVAARGRLFDQLPSGSMLNVALSEEEIRPLMDERLSIAAINADSLCVVSGPSSVIDEMANLLTEKGVEYRQIHIDVAAHSSMVEPLLEPFARIVERIQLKAPGISYVSNVTGKWITATEATDPGYWTRHLRQTVRFSDGIYELMKRPNPILLEVGPGQTLSLLARLQSSDAQAQTVISSVRHPQDQRPDEAVLLTALGKLWLAGAGVDWQGIYAGQSRRRIPLPTYPFERKRHWIESSLNINNRRPAGEGSHHNKESASKHVSAPGKIAPRAAKVQKGMPMSTSKPDISRPDRIASLLKSIVQTFTGLDPAEIDSDMSFLEMGADSLTLLRASQVIQNKLGLKIPFRQLVAEFTTIKLLSSHIDQQLPSGPLLTEPDVEQAASETYVEQSDAGPYDDSFQDEETEEYDEGGAYGEEFGRRTNESNGGLEQIFAQQLQIISKQLDLLHNGAIPTASKSPGQKHDGRLQPQSTRPEAIPRRTIQGSEPEPYIAYQSVKIGPSRGLSARQQRHLDVLSARLAERTRGSKRLTSDYRPHLADNRNVAGFRLMWKEIFYPIIAERAAGSRIWDIDGNEYVDLTMGFGSLLFGHSPPFVMEAVAEYLSRGIQLGPQSKQAGEVARLFCELTGKERAAFCNSGTEAVMTALRLARTRTGRSKIALFEGCYHGGSDGVLVRSERLPGGEIRAVPMAPGIPPEVAESTLILPYNSDEAIDILSERAHELAAIMIEPLPSRRPDAQPIAFLKELRRLTEEAGAALIFDEVITGFRMHMRGAQGLFGVEADIATYGKAVGAGMPIGVIAGKSEYMDCIDGGMWAYGDDSYPREETTFYAGTFFKHPLVMAAAWASLNYMKERGPALQEELNKRTAVLVESLSDYFKETGLPLLAASFGSLFRFGSLPEFSYLDLFYYHLLEKGVYIWEGRNCYISTAHTDEDMEHVLRAVKESVTELQEGGFLSGESSHLKNGEDGFKSGPIVMPVTEGQRQVWISSQMSDESARAYNESITLHLRGSLNLEAMHRAVQKIVDRQESLRTSFSPDGDYQRISPSLSIEMPYVDFSALSLEERDLQSAQWADKQMEQVFDLTTAPLMRVEIAKLDSLYHLMVVTIHHIVYDGWSTGIVLQEIKSLYESECKGGASPLPEPLRFSDFARSQAVEQGPDMIRAETYWMDQFAEPVLDLELPADRPRPLVKSYVGTREFKKIDPSLCRAIRELSSQKSCTLYMTLLAGYKILLHMLSGQSDIIVGISSSGQSATGNEYLVGYCVNVLPLRTRIVEDLTIDNYLKQVRKVLLDAYDNQAYPYGRLLKRLNLKRDPGRSPLISAYFNLDRPAGSRLEFLDLDVEIVTNPNRYVRWDITWNVIETGNEIQIESIYNTDLFDSQTIRSWMRHYEAILHAIAFNSETEISRLKEIIAEADRLRRIEKAKEYERADLQMLKSKKRKAAESKSQ